MDIKFKLYPHPVLWSKNDDYLSSSFDCEIRLSKEIRKIGLEVFFHLKNRGLKQLIKNEKAEYLLHIESPASSYRINFSSSTDIMKISLSDENLLGKISLCPYIVAKTEISNYFNKSFNPDYGNISFPLSKGMILAIGTQQSFRADKEKDDLSKVPSIFTIYKKETTEELPMEIELNDEKIRIGLNKKDYENYYATISSHPHIVNSFLIYPALIFMFERLKEGLSDYSTLRWFLALEKMFKKYNMILNEDLLSARSSLELAQSIMNLPVSKALDTLIHFNEVEEA